MSQETGNDQLPNAGDIHFSIDGDLTGLEPWTEIEPGRYMPRRVRGSFRGRALGWVFTVPSSGSDDAHLQQDSASQRDPQAQ